MSTLQFDPIQLDGFDQKNVQKLNSWITRLVEYLSYALNNIDGTNMTGDIEGQLLKAQKVLGEISKIQNQLQILNEAINGLKEDVGKVDNCSPAISFSNLENVCVALGIEAKSYTTEDFVKEMPYNCFVQFTHNKNDSIKLLDMPQDYATVEFQKGRTVNYCRGFAIHTTSGSLYLYKYESSSSNNIWKKVITDQDNIETIFLKESMNRPTSANLSAASGERLGKVEYFLASSKMTLGKPKGDGHILQLNWDNNGGWDSQIALINGKDNCLMQHRGMSSGVWGNWKTILDSGNYTDYLTKSNIIKGLGYTPETTAWKRLSSNGGSTVSTSSVFSVAKEIKVQVGENSSGNYYTFTWSVNPNTIGLGNGIRLISGYKWGSVEGFCCVRLGRDTAEVLNCIVGNSEYKNNCSLIISYR